LHGDEGLITKLLQKSKFKEAQQKAVQLVQEMSPKAPLKRSIIFEPHANQARIGDHSSHDLSPQKLTQKLHPPSPLSLENNNNIPCFTEDQQPDLRDFILDLNRASISQTTQTPTTSQTPQTPTTSQTTSGVSIAQRPAISHDINISNAEDSDIETSACCCSRKKKLVAMK
jgi:hypothetical protein